MWESSPCQNCPAPPQRTFWKGLAVVFAGGPRGLRGTGVLTPGVRLSGCPQAGEPFQLPAPRPCALWTRARTLGEQVISLLLSFLWSHEKGQIPFSQPQVGSGQSPRPRGGWMLRPCLLQAGRGPLVSPGKGRVGPVFKLLAPPTPHRFLVVDYFVFSRLWCIR